MYEPQAALTRIDEWHRCREQSSVAMENEQRFGNPNLVVGEYDGAFKVLDPQAFDAQLEGLIHIGQKVFLTGEQMIGLITKLFLNASGHISHLAIRTAHLFGRHKLVPITAVSEVTSLRIQLTLNEDAFLELPEYQADSSIAEEVDRALWSDLVLRDTDYHEIDVRVKDGVITLNGHVITSMNQWRAVNAVKNIPGVLGVKNYLIPDDKLMLEVAEALGQMRQGQESKFFTKVENGLAVLVGAVSSSLLRDQAEQCVAEIPWVRGIINEIRVPGVILKPEDQRFLQPSIGKELLFKDGLSVTLRNVVINPNNRRVVAMVVMGRFPDPLRQGQKSFDLSEESAPERLVVLPVRLILYLTSSSGFLAINSDDNTQYENYDPSRFAKPDRDWLPPYPYCTDDVLFMKEAIERTSQQS